MLQAELETHMEKQRLTYSVGELAECSRTSIGFVRQQIREGKLKASRLGRRVLIPVQCAEQWLYGNNMANKG